MGKSHGAGSLEAEAFQESGQRFYIISIIERISRIEAFQESGQRFYIISIIERISRIEAFQESGQRFYIIFDWFHVKQ